MERPYVVDVRRNTKFIRSTMLIEPILHPSPTLEGIPPVLVSCDTEKSPLTLAIIA